MRRLKCWIAVPLVLAVAAVATDRAAAVAPVIKDEGKFFSPDAVKKANEEIRDIAKNYRADLLIETYESVPADQVDKVKAMSAGERSEFFHRWARARAEAEVVNGVFIIICRNPPHLYVEPTPKFRSTFDEATVKKLDSILLQDFRDKHYDEGLAAAIKFVREKLASSR